MAEAEAAVAAEEVKAVVEVVEAKEAVGRRLSTCLETSGKNSVQRSNKP